LHFVETTGFTRSYWYSYDNYRTLSGLLYCKKTARLCDSYPH